MALPGLPQPGPGEAINLGIVAGTSSPTGALGAGATDLCEISPGGQVALAGDSFSGNRMGEGAWSPSMGLHVLPGSLSLSGHVRAGNRRWTCKDATTVAP
jgi:hypothetical protein